MSPRACFAALAITTLFLSNDAVAQTTFPEKPIHFVVGYAPGGGIDNLARLVAERMSKTLGRNVVVDNMPGADGAIAAEFVANAKPDGYSIAWVTQAHVVTPGVRKLSYDPVKSFTPLMIVAYTPMLLVVPKALPVKSVGDLVELAKKKPGELNYASPGAVTAAALETGLLMNATGASMTYIGYKSGGEVIPALTRGDVQVYFGALTTLLPGVKAGWFTPLAVSSTLTRSPLLPEVPTMSEALGKESKENVGWNAALLPAGTPQPVVDKLATAMKEALASPELSKRLPELGFVLGDPPISGEQFRQQLTGDVDRWRELIKTFPGTK